MDVWAPKFDYDSGDSFSWEDLQRCMAAETQSSFRVNAASVMLRERLQLQPPNAKVLGKRRRTAAELPKGVLQGFAVDERQLDAEDWPVMQHYLHLGGTQPGPDLGVAPSGRLFADVYHRYRFLMWNIPYPDSYIPYPECFANGAVARSSPHNERAFRTALGGNSYLLTSIVPIPPKNVTLLD
jgi:hypothetical protein